MLRIEAHPLVEIAAIIATFPAALGEVPTSPSIRALFTPGAVAPMCAHDGVRAAVRDLLRHGGYKPTGRGKPSSEYLLRAHAEGALGAINAAVDACNAVSLHSGLPVSVIDLDRAREPLRVAIAPAGSRYVFNAAGQEIDLGGLLCLDDADGPCANAVKDAQRTKTSPATRRTLSVIWGTRALPGRAAEAASWCGALLAEIGAEVTSIVPPMQALFE